MIDAMCTAVVGSTCSCESETSFDREDESSDVCCVGGTRWSFSENKVDDNSLHSNHLL